MPYTQSQLDAIMKKPGQAFVPASKLPYAGRVAETLTRRLLYSWEDRAASAEYNLLKSAWSDIRNHAQSRAASLSLDTLGIDIASIRWRRDVVDYAKQRIERMSNDVAVNAYEYASTAYLAGFYGRLWGIQVSANVKPNINRPQMAQIGKSVLQPGLTEAQADMMAYAIHGQDWRDKFKTIWGGAANKIASTLSTAAAMGTGINAAIQQAGVPLGIASKPNAKTSAAFYQSQLETRTGVMRASNHGAVQAYSDNPDLVLSCMWVTSHDTRVCDECRSHEGQIFMVNDLVGIALLGLPPDGSHFGCRCSPCWLLLPHLTPNNEPPDTTFDDWLDDNDVDDLDTFMDKTKLKSSMV